MSSLARAEIPSRLNVGVCGLCSNAINWDRLESWCSDMLNHEGSHYLLEQALTAMLLAGQTCAVASPKQYVVKPSRTEAQYPKAVLHHYVGGSKTWYFRFGWRHIAEAVKS
jgi:hypothetical protein